MEKQYITASDVKRYAYCPKIIYFTHVLHIEERITEAMEYGKELHKEEYILPVIAKIKPVKIIKNPELVSSKLKVSGKPDFILVTRFREYIPVEVKWSEEEFKGQARKDHKLQLATYALLIDEKYSTNVKRGYIYYVRSGRIVEVHIPYSLKKTAIKTIRKIYSIVAEEKEPEVRISREKCANCGWRKWCKGAYG